MEANDCGLLSALAWKEGLRKTTNTSVRMFISLGTDFRTGAPEYVRSKSVNHLAAMFVKWFMVCIPYNVAGCCGVQKSTTQMNMVRTNGSQHDKNKPKNIDHSMKLYKDLILKKVFAVIHGTKTSLNV
jgi:hypothetical protein